MEMKENDYLCPNCKGHLNVSESLVFATKTSRKHKGLLLLSPKVGFSLKKRANKVLI